MRDGDAFVDGMKALCHAGPRADGGHLDSLLSAENTIPKLKD